MGAWGIGSFENDDAADWLSDLTRSTDLSVIADALELDEQYVEAPDGSMALAAIEIVLALLGTPRQKLPDEALAWVKQHASLDVSGSRDRSIAALKLLLSDKSELRELWEETDDFQVWEADLTDMIRLLEDSQK